MTTPIKNEAELSAAIESAEREAEGFEVALEGVLAEARAEFERDVLSTHALAFVYRGGMQEAKAEATRLRAKLEEHKQRAELHSSFTEL